MFMIPQGEEIVTPVKEEKSPIKGAKRIKIKKSGDTPLRRSERNKNKQVIISNL